MAASSESRLVGLFDAVYAKALADGIPVWSCAHWATWHPDVLRFADLPGDIHAWLSYVYDRQELTSIFFLDVNPPGELTSLEFDSRLLESRMQLLSDRLRPPTQGHGRRVFLLNGGSSSGVYADLAPGPSGVRGQIVTFGDCGSCQSVVSNRWVDFLERFLDSPADSTAADAFLPPRVVCVDFRTNDV